MLVVYASRTGNVESIVSQLSVSSQTVNDGDVSEDYILITYTDGAGEVPYEVDMFLANNSAHLKGVIASGDMAYGEENYCKAGDVIAETYGVPVLLKIENAGSPEDIAKIEELVK